MDQKYFHPHPLAKEESPLEDRTKRIEAVMSSFSAKRALIELVLNNQKVPYNYR